MSRTDTRVSRKTFDTACDNLWKERQKNAALLKAVEGAQSALRKALPFCPPDNEAIYVGEWLGEVNEVIAKAKGG